MVIRNRREGDEGYDEHRRDREHQALTWKWLAGVLLGVILVLVGSWAAMLQGRMSSVENTIALRGERITAIEGRATLMEQRFGFIDGRLQELVDGQKALASAINTYRAFERGK